MGLRLNGSSFDVVRLLAGERWVTIGVRESRVSFEDDEFLGFLTFL